MKKVVSCLTTALVVFASSGGLAQDAVKVDPAHYKVLIDNASVRVLRIDYAPGATSKPHQHPDAIVVPLAASKVRFTMPDGKSEEVDMPSESATYSAAATHTPSNVGKTKIDGILVEFKSPKPGTAALPATRDGLGMKVLAEGPRAVAARMTAEPTFHEAPGSKHDYDQVVIALGAAKMSLTIDGQKPKTSWTRGDVAFIGRGVAHEARNVGGTPVEFIVISIK